MRMKESHLGPSMFKSHLGSERMLGRSASAATDLLKEFDFTTTSQPAALDSYSRASVAAPITGVDGSGGVEVIKFSSGAYAYGYDAGFSHGSKLGMLVELAATNVCDDSESWTFISGTGTNNFATAPDGTTTAAKYTRTGGGGACRAGGSATISNSTTYTISCFVKEDPANPGANYLLDAAGLSDSYSAVPTEWTRVSRTFTSNATTTTCDVKLQNNSESILVWGMQLELNDVATSYIPTSGASAARVKTAAKVTGAYGKGFVLHTAGEVQAEFIMQSAATTTYFYDISTATGTAGGDRKFSATFNGGTSLSNRVYDSALKANATVSYAVDDGAEHAYRFYWDESTGATVVIDVSNTATSAVAFTPGTADSDIYFGGDYTNNNLPAMLLAKFRIYSQEQS